MISTLFYRLQKVTTRLRIKRSLKQWNSAMQSQFLSQKKWNEKFALLGARWRGSGEAIPAPTRGANPVSIFCSASFPVGIGQKGVDLKKLQPFC